MGRGPKVSVIIPTYNHALYLPGAIQSVLDQTFRDFEMIVVDDGSTDDTAEVIKPFFADPRFRYIHQRNRGLAAARNTGIKHTEGELVAFLDADDLWLPEKLEEEVRIIDRGGPEVRLVYCFFQYIDQGGNILETVTEHPIKNPTYKDLLYCNWVLGSSSAVLIRKKAFDEVGLFDESLRSLEDIDMWIRILRGHKSLYVDKVLVQLRRTITSMSAVKDAAVRKREHQYIAHIQKYIDRFTELADYRKEALFRVAEGMLYSSYVYGKKGQMFKYYLKAGLQRPTFWFTSIVVYLRKYFLRGKGRR
jgi:glycosyltransferase involved in cell wall biosynthesis